MKNKIGRSLNSLSLDIKLKAYTVDQHVFKVLSKILGNRNRMGGNIDCKTVL